MTHETRRAAGLATIALLAVCVPSWLYMGYLRPRSDAVLAAQAIAGLEVALDKRAAGIPLSPDDFALEERVALFTDSDAARRVQAADAIRRSGVASHAAIQVARLQESGETTITFDDAPGAQEALADFPQLAKDVVPYGAEDAFRDATATVKFLVKAGRDDASRAQQLLEAQYGTSGLNLQHALLPEIGLGP